jgi:AcrR family transcriptional regulator
MAASLKADLPKGDRTRARILDEAVELASVQGLGALTIGPLADRLGLSKSGLFAHFRSKEALQVETLEHAAELFRADVTEPIRAVPDRADRLRVFFARWIAWLEDSGLTGGCPILAAAVEFDDVPGPVRDAAARQLGELQSLIAKFAPCGAPGRRCGSNQRRRDRACDVASRARAAARRPQGARRDHAGVRCAGRGLSILARAD